MQTTAPWLTLVHENPSKGLFNTAIIENDGTQWGSGCFAIEASSEQEARDIEAWMTSDEIQNEVRKLLALKNTHTMSGPMLACLPHYK